MLGAACTAPDLPRAPPGVNARRGAGRALEPRPDPGYARVIDAAFAEIGRRRGELNTLVNVAGPGAGQATFDAIADAEWRAAFEIGALAAVRGTRAALPLLRQARWARVVNVSAHSTKRQSARLAAYTAAKSALTGISKNMSLALAKEEILVNTVSPGSFASPSFQAAMRRLPRGPRVKSLASVFDSG